VDSYEDRLAAVEAEWRAKYNAEELKEMAGKEAMADESYPIADQDDLEKAIKAVGRGSADHDAIRKHVMARAKALKLSSLIPDNWNADGSLADEEQKAAAWAAEHREGISYSDMRELLQNAVAAKFGGDGDKGWIYIRDFADDWVVYESYEGEDFRCSYSVDGDVVTLGDPEPVTAKTSYELVQTNSSAGRTERRHKERHRAIPLMPEVRQWAIQPTSVEIRSGKNADEAIITGSPIMYGVDYEVFDMFGKFTERMASGVCSDVLKRGVDTRFLFNHDGLPLGRTSAGTLILQDSQRSLDCELHVDMRQQLANDLVIAIDRRDVTQMSIGFVTGRDEWDEAMAERTVLVFADLPDVSAVTYPASPTTQVQIAQRMMLAAPIESRARLRNFLVAERAGKTLSGASQGKVISAIEALHSLYEAGGGNPADLIQDEGESESTETALTQDGTRSEDGEPIRSSALALRLQLEARSKKRKRQKIAA
jgi:HK97 family phage prohead protease